jgi:Animal haem peroxidase
MGNAATATAHLSPARDHCLAPSRSVDAPLGYGGKYQRLFPELGPLVDDEDFLLSVGYSGGICDGSPLADEPGCDDAQVAAGWPFFGQFIAHDITADRSTLQEHADPELVRNFRTPRVNLECLYGAGPVGSPFLYDRDDPAKLLIGANEEGKAGDLPRNQQGLALVGDPRNDVHLFMSQLHLAMLKVHNGLVDRLRADGVAEGDLFDEAARTTAWHYQWIVVHDFLPTLVGRELIDELSANGPRHYDAGASPFIPFEFADAAYRYGHSQIRHTYRINGRTGELELFPDLIGFAPVPSSHTIDWSYLFALDDDRPPQPAKRIDGKLARSLIELPMAITGDVEVEQYHSLAVRDLQRGHALGLPSGETVARHMGERPLTPEQVGLSESGWEGETPLWFYVLREADVHADGNRLGPVGGRIVAEVLLGIIDVDPGSFRATEPDWRPTLPAENPEQFTIVDLLRFAQTGE